MTVCRPGIHYFKSEVISGAFCFFFQQNDEINQSACDLAKGVAQEGGVFCAGSICQTARLYAQGAGKERIQKRFEEQIAIFLKNDMDLLIAEVSKRQCRSISGSYRRRLRAVSLFPENPLKEHLQFHTRARCCYKRATLITGLLFLASLHFFFFSLVN